MNTIEGALVFAGIPLAVVGVVFGTTPKPPRAGAKDDPENDGPETEPGK